MLPWKSRSAVIMIIAALLTSCSDEDFRASVTVLNDVPGPLITDIYVAKDCTEEWGAAKATGLSVPANTWSAPVVVDWEEKSYAVIHPGLNNIGSSIVVDVRACFDSGTCGIETSFRIHDGDLESVIIRDEGFPNTMTRC